MKNKNITTRVMNMNKNYMKNDVDSLKNLNDFGNIRLRFNF